MELFNEFLSELASLPPWVAFCAVVLATFVSEDLIRDVVFLPSHAPDGRTVVVSLEVPRGWASRYDETRQDVVGSLRAPRPPRPGSRVTRVQVAAIE